MASDTCPRPQAWNAGAAMTVVSPLRSGIRDSAATASSTVAPLRAAPRGRPGRAAGEDHLAGGPSRHGRRTGGSGDREPVQLLGRGGDTTGQAGRDDVAELLVEQQRPCALPAQHGGERSGRESGAEVQDVGADLRQRDRPLDQAAAVAGEQAGGVARAQPTTVQIGRQPVGAEVDLAEGQHAPVVDERRPVRRAGRSGGVTRGRRDAVARHGEPHGQQPVRPDGRQQPGAREHPHTDQVEHRASPPPASWTSTVARPAAGQRHPLPALTCCVTLRW